MKCFNLNLNRLANILLLGKEHLSPQKAHLTRKTDSYVLYVITDGELSLLHNNEPLVLKSGEFCLFSPGDTHKPLGISECKYYYVHFDADIKALELDENVFAEEIQKKNIAFAGQRIYSKTRYYYRSMLLPERLQVKDKIDFNYIANKLEQNIKVFRRLSINENLYLSFDLFKIFLKCESIGEQIYGTKQPYSRNSNSSVNKIAEYLNSHYLEEIDGKVIEKEFMINYDYANHLFKKALGESILKYRNSLRIEHAKFLLITTDMSVQEIALESGFSDKFYFTRYFTKCTGISPLRFRKAERRNV